MKFLLALAAFLLTSLAAQADCTSPAGVAGKIFFNTAYKVLEYCDGTTWYNLGTPNAAGALGNCTNPAGPPGKLIYNTAHNVLQYCNGTGWINLGAAQDNAPVNCTNPVSKPGQLFFNTSSKTVQYCNGATWVNTGRWELDTDPDPFNFTNLTGQNLSTQVSSDIIQITGLGGITTVSVSGAGSPQIRVCNDAACSSVQTTWGTSMNIANGKYLQARQTTSASNSTAVTATITIGTLGNSVWSVTTLDDTTPDAYSFTNLTGQNLSTQVNSNIIQITGINVSVTTATSGASSEIRTCADSGCSTVLTTWGTSMQIANNQYLQARQITSGSGSTSTSATITVGTGTTTWSATTRVDDLTPDSYSFTDLTNQNTNTQVNSNIIQITGINMAVTAATSGASSEIRSCSDSGCSFVLSTWTSSLSISNNQYLQVRQTTSGSNATSTSATITVGTGTTTWSATTSNPANYFFTATGNSTWVVPAGITSIRVDCIGGGGGGAATSGTPRAGGGGAWARSTISVTPGATVYISVAAQVAVNTAGQDTWLNTVANSAPSSASNGCLAKGGGAGGNNVNGAGGAAGSSIGDSSYSGGSSAASGTGNRNGGGGAAGPNGAGLSTTGTGILTAGAAGDAGFGGAGGASGVAGGNGTEYDGTYGSGGGGGGANTAGAGGLYGGGGGAGINGTTGGRGAQGLVVIYY